MTGCYTYIGSKIQVSNNTVNPVDNVSGFFNSIEYIDGTSQTINTNSINNFYNNIPITVSNEFDSVLGNGSFDRMSKKLDKLYEDFYNGTLGANVSEYNISKEYVSIRDNFINKYIKRYKL